MCGCDQWPILQLTQKAWSQPVLSGAEMPSIDLNKNPSQKINIRIQKILFTFIAMNSNCLERKPKNSLCAPNFICLPFATASMIAHVFFLKYQSGQLDSNVWHTQTIASLLYAILSNVRNPTDVFFRFIF